MNENLKKGAQNVQDALRTNGIKAKVVLLPDSARTAQDASKAIGCEVAQITKSLIFKTESTHRPVLILASGPNRVDEKVIESHIGEKIVKADADFAREITGFAIGGIPPLGHKQKIELTFIDESLLKFDSVWAAAGTPHTVFNLRASDLRDVTDGKVMSIG